MNRFMAVGMLLQVLAVTQLASAEDLPELRTRRDNALRNGPQVSSVRDIRREVGPGREATWQDLITRLEEPLGPGKAPLIEPGDTEAQDVQDVTVVRSTSSRRWSLQVGGDGTAASFNDDDASTAKRSLGVPVESRIPTQRLVELGKTFVSDVLGNQVRLGSRERLVPLATRYLIADSAERGATPGTVGTATPPRVVAGRIVFGREVDGVAVLGPSSWVSVTFANDETPVAFEFDWPRYVRKGPARAVLDLNGVLTRALERTQVSLESPSVDIRGMDCGLYDSGTPGAALQPACVLDYNTVTNGDVAALSDPIPAGVQVEADPAWPESTQARREAPRGAQRNAVLGEVRARLTKTAERLASRP